MRKIRVCGFLACMTLVFFLLSVPSATAGPEEEVLKVITNWARAFNTGDEALMTSLFWTSPDATRFGPGQMGSFLMQGGDSIVEFWKATLAATKGAIEISTHNTQATLIGDDVAVLTAYAVSIYTDPATKEQSIGQVRGTFVVQKIKGKWLIVHEHSSNLPVE